ncbi:iron chelate uptake ABC transporter family permease subunit [Phytoactinopolyspora limicola]|uniref:iron chelate uptake ABC transporter family permease subunit n=1 Tax=Phytoactinopolyspora limicola TaxID=2715536 RepID=UPI001A9C4628|nr:iron chelate uptake ABC transporter family permease subunit [Phytoactinopolyspora limicola]
MTTTNSQPMVQSPAASDLSRGPAIPGPVPAHPPATVGRYWLRLTIVLLVAVLAAVLIVTYDNPAEPGSRGFWTIVNNRLTSVATITIVGICHGVATVAFHSVTNNRILTPSILGFDALYRAVQTALVFFLGAGAVAATNTVGHVVAQSLLMIAFATALYGWLFSGKRASLHVLLLVGVVLGMGFGSLATFMQRLLTPSEFDILTARLFATMSQSDSTYLPIGFAAVVGVGFVLWRRRHVLDVVSMGREVATGLGVRYQREVMLVLVMVAVLISVSTSLTGPMTFFGFLVAMLTYQLVGTSSHQWTLPMVAALSVATLLSAYFVLRHVFYAQGLISVIIELVGGLAFLVYLLRKGLR